MRRIYLTDAKETIALRDAGVEVWWDGEKFGDGYDVEPWMYSRHSHYKYNKDPITPADILSLFVHKLSPLLFVEVDD